MFKHFLKNHFLNLFPYSYSTGFLISRPVNITLSEIQSERKSCKNADVLRSQVDEEMRQKILEKMKVDLVEVKNWNGIKELEKKADLAIMAIGDEFYKARVYWKDRQPPAYKKMTSGVGHMMGDLLMATSSARCNGSSGDIAFFFFCSNC